MGTIEFSRFYELRLAPKYNYKKSDLLPGEYKAHWKSYANNILVFR